MSQNKKVSIAFYWHMHQPVYQLSPEGDYLMPWVRLHAVKDYLDMVTILDNFKNIKLNFNVVPVLLDAFIDYGEKGLHDLHSRLTVTPVEDLNSDDKEFILNNFFDSNYQTMIFPYEEYSRNGSRWLRLILQRLLNKNTPILWLCLTLHGLIRFIRMNILN